MKVALRVFGVFAVLVLTSCQFFLGTAEEDPIRIGVAGPHTGPPAEYGVPPLRAAELLVEAANATGGILDREIVIVKLDDQCDPAQAEPGARTLLNSGVVAVIGHICSGATSAAMAVYENSGIPVISPASTSPDLTTAGYSNFFRTILPDDYLTQSMVDTGASASAGASDLVIVYDETLAFAAAGYATMEDQITTAGLTHLSSEGVDFGDSADADGVVTTVQSSDADALLVLGGDPSTLAAFVNDLRPDYAGTVVLSHTAFEQEFIDELTADSSGIYVIALPPVDARAAARTLRQDHTDTYGGEPGAFFNNGAAAVQILLTAIDGAGTTSAGQLRSAVATGTFDTVLGEISFNAQGTPSGGDVDYVAYEIVDDAFQASSE